MEGEMSKQTYKLVEYKDNIYEIPVRKITEQPIILWSDVQSIIPKATCCFKNSKLVSFQLDTSLNEIMPKRIPLSSEEEKTIWKVHVPEDHQELILGQISNKLDYLIQHHLLEQNRQSRVEPSVEEDTSNNNENIPSVADSDHASSSSTALSSLDTVQLVVNSSTNNVTSNSRHEAPPSYETSMLSTIHALISKLRLFESHIPNRHKSPKWLSKREAWVSQEPNNIEEIASLLVQLEMALLWTAVTESWIDERETWLTLVGSSRSERHLAGAIINLERHTLVLDESWATLRERWLNELLEMVVLPLSHG